MAKGVNFIVKIDGKVLGGQRGASLSRSAGTIDVTTKDSNEWREQESGIKEWSLTADGLLVEDDEAYGLLEEAYLNGTKVQVALETPGGNKYHGDAIITDFPLDVPYDDAVTYSLTFNGTGPLIKAVIQA